MSYVNYFENGLHWIYSFVLYRLPYKYMIFCEKYALVAICPTRVCELKLTVEDSGWKAKAE